MPWHRFKSLLMQPAQTYHSVQLYRLGLSLLDGLSTFMGKTIQDTRGDFTHTTAEEASRRTIKRTKYQMDFM